MFDALSKYQLHHAYILEGRRETVLHELKEFLQKEMGIEAEGNPNFWLKEYASFGVDDARELQEAQSRKAVSESARVFVLALNSITLPSQNALLKIFEEPGECTHLFMIIPSASRILPTLRSRVDMLSSDSVEQHSQAKGFIAASKPERLKMIKELLAQIEKEEKTKQDAVELLQDILFLKYEKSPSSEWSGADVILYENLLKDVDYASDTSSSIKLLLEHAALLI